MESAKCATQPQRLNVRMKRLIAMIEIHSHEATASSPSCAGALVHQPWLGAELRRSARTSDTTTIPQ
eukprot:15170332-Alexandrium_andersonii.AAC.1